MKIEVRALKAFYLKLDLIKTKIRFVSFFWPDFQVFFVALFSRDLWLAGDDCVRIFSRSHVS